MCRCLFNIVILWLCLSCHGQDGDAHLPAKANDEPNSAWQNKINRQQPEKGDSTYIGMAAPVIKAVGAGGDSLHKAPLKSVVFYNFWFTGCAPCIAEMPYFNTLVENYGNHIDFVAITFEDHKDVAAFLNQHPFNFKHYNMPRSNINALGIARGFPTTFIAVDGVIVDWKAGGFVASNPHFNEEMEKQMEHYHLLFSKYLK